MSMSGMLEMRAEVEAARAALLARALEAIEKVRMIAPAVSGAIGEVSVDEATIALVREFENVLRGRTGCPECGSIVPQAGCPVCGTPADVMPAVL
jgi:rubrerythrin